MSDWKTVPASTIAKRTTNPIRKLVDQIQLPANPPKPMIKLTIGDPTAYDGCFDTHQTVVDAVVDGVKSFKNNGYLHSAGSVPAREAVAKKYSCEGRELTANDVILANGCSGALDIAIKVLCNQGQNIILPKPGFSLYVTLSESLGVECRFYDLIPEKEWDIDIETLKKQVDSNTAAILINNPSNPCGSVIPEETLLKVIQIAEEHHVPIISDEIYGEIVFPHSKRSFKPISQLTKTVPVLTVGGLAKQWLVPGWRLGWVLVSDRNGLFTEVRDGLLRLTTLILGPCSVIQGALPRILSETPQSFYTETSAKLEKTAQFIAEKLEPVEALTVIPASAAMYVMVKVHTDKLKDVKDDMHFTQLLLDEEALFVLPCCIFGADNFFRVVLCGPEKTMEEACSRLTSFCERHAL